MAVVPKFNLLNIPGQTPAGPIPAPSYGPPPPSAGASGPLGGAALPVLVGPPVSQLGHNDPNARIAIDLLDAR